MNDIKTPILVDLQTMDGLTLFFRFALGFRESRADRGALKRVEERFGLSPFFPTKPGSLEDVWRELEEYPSDDQFDAVCALVEKTAGANWLLSSIAEDLAYLGSTKEVVRFSFIPAILPCLLHARDAKKNGRKAYHTYNIRYAGLGSDVQLVAFVSLYLGLPIYTEINPPWDPDQVFDDDVPNSEPPDLEISFPPSDFRSTVNPYLERSLRKSQLPRVVDRGKYDIESVMVQYLANQTQPALAFVSEKFTASPRQTCGLVRKQLLEMKCVSRVTAMADDGTKHTNWTRTLLELDTTGGQNETIMMVQADEFAQLTGPFVRTHEARGKAQRVSVEEVIAAGRVLKPTRYIAKNQVGGRGIAETFNNSRLIPQYRLADLFRVIRPKTTRNDPLGNSFIQEIRAGDLTDLGQILAPSRKIEVQDFIPKRLEDQLIQSGDILFAHRGPIGRVAYVNDDDLHSEHNTYASQSLMILRPRPAERSRAKHAICDPRVLFMYLLATMSRGYWTDLAIGDRSLAIPIGEIERLGLSEKLLLPPKTKLEAWDNHENPHHRRVLSEFQKHQERLIKIKQLNAAADAGLQEVWDAAW